MLILPDMRRMGSRGFAMWSKYLRVGPSGVSRAGRGLYAVRDLKKDTMIPYFGRRVTKEDDCYTVENSLDNSMVSALDERGEVAPMNICGIINEAPPGAETNAMLFDFDSEIFPRSANQRAKIMDAARKLTDFEREFGVYCARVGYILQRDVAQGEELLTFYGDEFDREYEVNGYTDA